MSPSALSMVADGTQGGNDAGRAVHASPCRGFTEPIGARHGVSLTKRTMPPEIQSRRAVRRL
jgi:hypothetical protein